MKSATALIVVAAILSVALGLNCFECPTCGEQGTNKGDFCPTGCGEVAAAAGGAGGQSALPAYGVCSYTGQINANGDRVAPGDSGAACAASGYCGGCICKTGENEFVNGYGNGTPFTIGGSGTKIIDDCCHLNDDICNLLINDASCPAQSTKVNPSDVPGNQGLDACVPGSNLFAHGNEYYDAAADEYKWDGWGNCCTCLCDDGNDCTDDTYDHETNTCIFTERCAPLSVLNDPDHECQQRSCTPGSTPAGQCDWFTDTNARCDTDGNPCTVGTCIPDAADPQSATCQDGDGAKRDDCDSGNPCEAGTCVDNVGCEVEQIATGQSCLGDGDGDKCTINDICNADGVCEGEKRCADSQTCDPLVGQCVDSTPLAVVGAGIAGAAICAAVAAAGLLNRRGDEEDNESWAKMSSGSSYGNKRMTTATQMSSFTRGGGSGDRSSRGSRSSRSSKGKRMTGITQMSGASRGEMMGLEGASSGSRATMGTVASQMSRATRSTSGSRNSRSSRGSRNSRSSKGRSHASQGTRSSGSRNSRSSRGRH